LVPINKVVFSVSVDKKNTLCLYIKDILYRKVLIRRFYSEKFLVKIREDHIKGIYFDLSRQEKPGTTVIDPANDIMSHELMILDIKDTKKL